MDLISRKAALDALRKCRFVEDAYEKIKWLPSAEPASYQQVTGKLDCISRQAAIDAILNVPDHDDGMVFEALSHAQRDVALLPPSQPEIIRCKDCKHGVDYYHDGDCYCLNQKWGATYFGGSLEFYCAAAKRRADE